LLTMEALLFRLITIAFVLLTLTLARRAVLRKPVRQGADASTTRRLFAFVSWVIFGALLTAVTSGAGAGDSRCAGRWPALSRCMLAYRGQPLRARGHPRPLMDEIPLSTQFAALALLLVCSAFFSMSETAMMASNRIRLRHMAQEGHRGARLAVALLGKTDHCWG
jgi:hypothetical protein